MATRFVICVTDGETVPVSWAETLTDAEATMETLACALAARDLGVGQLTDAQALDPRVVRQEGHSIDECPLDDYVVCDRARVRCYAVPPAFTAYMADRTTPAAASYEAVSSASEKLYGTDTLRLNS